MQSTAYNLLGHLHGVEDGELLVQLGFDFLLVVSDHLSDLIRQRSSRDASAESCRNYAPSWQKKKEVPTPHIKRADAIAAAVNIQFKSKKL